MGDTYVMEATLHNPLPSSILLNRLETLHDSSHLVCIAANEILIPPFTSVTSRLLLIPLSCGPLVIRGLRVGLRSLSHVGSHRQCVERNLLELWGQVAYS